MRRAVDRALDHGSARFLGLLIPFDEEHQPLRSNRKVVWEPRPTKKETDPTKVELPRIPPISTCVVFASMLFALAHV